MPREIGCVGRISLTCQNDHRLPGGNCQLAALTGTPPAAPPPAVVTAAIVAALVGRSPATRYDARHARRPDDRIPSAARPAGRRIELARTTQSALVTGARAGNPFDAVDFGRKVDSAAIVGNRSRAGQSDDDETGWKPFHGGRCLCRHVHRCHDGDPRRRGGRRTLRRGITETTRHLIMSVSKSIVGCVSGVLVGQGKLDPVSVVTDYVPELSESVTGVRPCVMSSTCKPGSGSARSTPTLTPRCGQWSESVGWAPALPSDPVGAYAYLITIGSAQKHGGEFTYRSADTDVLGWICERASGVRMAALISTLIWQPMGAEFDAEITCDRMGTAIHDGGVSATLRDRARFGQMLLDGGMVGDRQVIPSAWLDDTFEPLRTSGRHSPTPTTRRCWPAVVYRNQFWLYRNRARPILLCLGIHGATDLRRPRCSHRDREAVVLAGRATFRLPGGHAAGLWGDRRRSRRRQLAQPAGERPDPLDKAVEGGGG